MAAAALRRRPSHLHCCGGSDDDSHPDLPYQYYQYRYHHRFNVLVHLFFIWITLAALIFPSGYCQTPSATGSKQHTFQASCRQIFSEIKFNRTELPDAPISVQSGQICSSTFTCCTKAMENQLTVLSFKEYQNLMRKAIEPIRTIFTSRTNKFDEFFKALLNNSYNDLHVMYVTTYGLLYQQNSAIFSKLFVNLNNYYKGRDVDLEAALKSFFVSLLKKMYQLMNPNYVMDAQHLNCIGSKMDVLEPFTDIPAKLSTRVKKAFITARTFVQGLSIGRDVIVAISKINPSPSCIESVTQMMYCQRCSGIPEKKPCSNYCIGTIQACQPYNKEFNIVWNQYIHALKQVAQQLDRPFNIEAVVDPINVKISDAIMTFQNRAAVVTEKIFSKCGHPTVRNKRQTENVKYEKFDYEWPSKKNQMRPTTAAGTSLDRLVRDINEKVKLATDFWITVPNNVCKDEKLAAENIDDKYSLPIANNSSLTKATTDEDCWSTEIKETPWSGMLKDETDRAVAMDSESMKTNSIISYQVSQLKSMTDKLRDAYNGLDVESVPTDIYGSGDSSGYDEISGSGSGDRDHDEDTVKNSNDHKTNSDGSYYFVNTTTKRPKSSKPLPTPKNKSSASQVSWSIAGISLAFAFQLTVCLLL